MKARNNTIDIFKAVKGEDSENIKKAVISEHLTLIAPKTYYMEAKHEKPYSFLMEKIATRRFYLPFDRTLSVTLNV